MFHGLTPQRLTLSPFSSQRLRYTSTQLSLPAFRAPDKTSGAMIMSVGLFGAYMLSGPLSLFVFAHSSNQPPSSHKVRPGRRYQAPATSTFLFLLPSQEKFFFLLLFSETPKREDLPYSSLAFPSSILFPRPGISSRKTASPGAVLKPQHPE